MSVGRTLLLALVLPLLRQWPAFAATKPYVVYLGEHSHDPNEGTFDASQRIARSHYGLLESLLGDKQKAQDALFYSYTQFINGFAANLDEDSAQEISKYDGVVSVFESRGYNLHTTRSWQFLGLENNGHVLPESIWVKASYGKDTIIGNLDTGVWPEAESFKDEGLGPIPSKWKGICQNEQDKNFTCNRKLIGARYFNKGYIAAVGPLDSSFMTPRDTDGHGTHTLSTLGGRFVKDASVLGYGNGTAKGGSPLARVAAYKVCWPPINGSECFDSDILAAFDAALADGIDVLSLSLGGTPGDYFSDGIAIGSFHAIRRNVTVVCSAGNSGPTAGTVTNVAPWIFTVGASTMDREFPAYIKFDNRALSGESLSEQSLENDKLYPIISSKDAASIIQSVHDAQLCFRGSLDPEKVKDKIVVCLRGINARVEKGEAVREAGGAGMVLANDITMGNEILADAHVLPATHITYSDGLVLFSYLNSTKSPVGYITKPYTELGTKPAPFMAAFSSQGPNPVTPEILKPDITAPGVSVIAAYTEASSPTGLAFDHRRLLFNSVSGTSMSCPHVSGIVGLLKTLYPDWSPAAIRSAIMTSARTGDNKREPMLNATFTKATSFSYGTGHVQPNRAMDPGLVYDLTTSDYLNFLCSIGYNSSIIATFDPGFSRCPSEHIMIEDLNYPSITVAELSGSITVNRTVKNVGSAGTYTVRVTPPIGIEVTVTPNSLKFDAVGQERSFNVTLKAKKATEGYVFGRFRWSDGKHYVRSPIVVKAI